MTVEYHVLEFNPEGADFPANSTRTTDTTVFRAGAANPSVFGMASDPTANDMRSRTQLSVTEKDSSGTTSVKALSVLFWGAYPIASTTLTVDVLPNHWRSFWIYTDDGHYSYSHDLVIVTNIVS